jgi:hypothetical protein
MKAQAGPLCITRSRPTQEGLLVQFRDGEIYLFHTSFLIANRLNHADRVRSQAAIQHLIDQSQPHV